MPPRLATLLLLCLALVVLGAGAAAAQTTVAPASPATPAPAPAQAVPGTTTTSPVGAQTTSGSRSDDTGPLVLLAVVGALLLLLALVWAAARWAAWEPGWWVRWRHAVGEAGWRASANWAEFRDWVRLGR